MSVILIIYIYILYPLHILHSPRAMPFINKQFQLDFQTHCHAASCGIPCFPRAFAVGAFDSLKRERGVTCAFAANDLYRETWGQFTRSLLRLLLLGEVFLPKDHGSKSNKIVAWWSFDMVRWCWVWQEFGETWEINVNHNVFSMFWGLRWWHRDFFEATPSKARNRNQTLFITFPDMQRATFVFDCFLNASK